MRCLQTSIANVVTHFRGHPGDWLLTRLVTARDTGELGQEELDSIISSS